MTVIVPPHVSQVAAISPISQILPPQYRFAGDDWDDETAFVFTFYTGLPTFDLDGHALTVGTVRDLTGCTFSGTVEYAPPRNPFRVPLMWDPSPVTMVGTITVSTGQGALTLASAQTRFRQQSRDLWRPDRPGFERDAMLIVRARMTDSLRVTTTVGVVPLFVF